MTATKFRYLIIQALVYKFVTSQVPPSVTQYLHLSEIVQQHPGIFHQPTTIPRLQPVHIPSQNLHSYTGVPAGIPSTPQALKPCPCTKPHPPPPSPPSGLDSTLLNNLAIALQLLIVSNILNTPVPDSPASPSNPVSPVCPTVLPSPSLPVSPAVPAYPTPPIYPAIPPYPSPPVSPAVPAFLSPPVSEPVLPAYSIPSGYETPSVAPMVSYAHPQTQSSHQPSPVYPPQASPRQPYCAPNPYETASYSNFPSTLPNANFLGSSSFVDTNAIQNSMMAGLPPVGSFGNPYCTAAPPNPRASMTLMSPYDAIGPNSPFSDPILNSPYGTMISSKKDFQSPYAAILAADNKKDSFSMSDFF